jgi:DNA polymerase-3 subunit delta'
MNKYNWKTFGQGKISQFLQKNLDNNKLAHAYLFVGKEHLGKSLLAKEFTKSILCQDYHRQSQNSVEFLPCGQCVFCQQFEKGIHPDVYFLKKEEDKKNIIVEQVREMQKILYLASFLNSYKIALIEQAGDLNESAQNALLKVLEEPRKKTILILVANDLNMLLPTIISRCRVIKFQPVATEMIFHYLINLGANREEARVFSSLAHGQIGLAISFFNNPDYYKLYLERTKQFIELFSYNLTNRFKMIGDTLSVYDTPLGKAEFLIQELDDWQIFLRDILFLKNNLGHLITNWHFQEQLQKLAGEFTSRKTIMLMKKIEEIKATLSYNINPRLAVENLLLNF